MPADPAIKFGVVVLLQTAVVFKPVNALTNIVFVKQVKVAINGVTVYVGAIALTFKFIVCVFAHVPAKPVIVYTVVVEGVTVIVPVVNPPGLQV